MIVMEESDGEGESLADYIYSTDGSTANTGIATGSHSGKSAKVLQSHATLEKVGPLFKPYDPAWSALLAMNF